MFVFINDPNTIKWDKNRKLTYTDFVQVSTPLPNGATAITSTGIWMDRDDTRPCGWRAYAVFDKIGSMWYIHGQTRFKKEILQHEQLHFDITNYMSMRLDSVLVRLPGKLTQIELNNLYDKYRFKLDSMQRWYDKAVDHSRDSTSQVRWNHYVDSLLRK
jgi:hypothetical protein